MFRYRRIRESRGDFDDHDSPFVAIDVSTDEDAAVADNETVRAADDVQDDDSAAAATDDDQGAPAADTAAPLNAADDGRDAPAADAVAAPVNAAVPANNVIDSAPQVNAAAEPQTGAAVASARDNAAAAVANVPKTFKIFSRLRRNVLATVDRVRGIEPGTDLSLSEGPKLNAVMMTIVFLSIVSGDSILSLPWTIANLGWPSLLIFAGLIILFMYSAWCLVGSWEIIEERQFIECESGTRKFPYAIISYHSFHNEILGRVMGVTFLITIISITISIITSMAQLSYSMNSNSVPGFGVGFWLFTVTICTAPLSYLGSMKNLGFVAIGALLSTLVTCILITVQMFYDYDRSTNLPTVAPVVPHVAFKELFLAFSSVFLTFGGLTIVSSAHIDATRHAKSNTSKNINISLCIMVVLFLPIAAGGYFVYGDQVNPNVLLSISDTWLTWWANFFMVLHQALAFVIIVNPMFNHFEYIFHISGQYPMERITLRSVVLLSLIFIPLTLPGIDKILAVIYSLTVPIITFVLPNFFYLRLCYHREYDMPIRYITRTITRHTVILIMIAMIVGTIISVIWTYGAIINAITTYNYEEPYYWSSIVRILHWTFHQFSNVKLNLKF